MTKSTEYLLETEAGFQRITLVSPDGTNRLTTVKVVALTELFLDLARSPKPVLLTGNERFFSAGADLNEIRTLSGADAYAFANMGQRLMQAVDNYPATVIGVIHGYCLGGGLDLALACDLRIAAPNAIFGHRGAALGIMTGWGGTQRLPRLIGKARALQMFVEAQKLHAAVALEIGLVNAVDPHPHACAARWIVGNRIAGNRIVGV